MYALQLTPEEEQCFSSYFTQLTDTENNEVSGQTAGNFLVNFGVDHQQLAVIWDICDERHNGYLSRNEFAACMRLVSQAQNGIPQKSWDVYKGSLHVARTYVYLHGTTVYTSYNCFRNSFAYLLAGPVPHKQNVSKHTHSHSSNSSQRHSSHGTRRHSVVDMSIFTKLVTEEERIQYGTEFDEILKQHPEIVSIPGQDTLLPGTIARDVFTQTGLHVSVLAQIWNLADFTHRGSLNKAEFVLAKHLGALCKENNVKHLPKTIIPQVYASAAGAPETAHVSVSPPVSSSAPVEGPALGSSSSKIDKYMSAPKAVEVPDVPAAGSSVQASEVTITPAVIPEAATTAIPTSDLATAPVVASASTFEPIIAPPVEQTVHYDPETLPAETPAPYSSSSEEQDPVAELARRILANDRNNYNSLFDRIDKQRKGYITGEDSVPFFVASRLDADELAKIWDLVDVKDSGILDKNGFAVAMELIRLRLTGKTIPDTLEEVESQLITLQVAEPNQAPQPTEPSIAPEPVKPSIPIQPTHSYLDDLKALEPGSSSAPPDVQGTPTMDINGLAQPAIADDEKPLSEPAFADDNEATEAVEEQDHLSTDIQRLNLGAMDTSATEEPSSMTEYVTAAAMPEPTATEPENVPPTSSADVVVKEVDESHEEPAAVAAEEEDSDVSSSAFESIREEIQTTRDAMEASAHNHQVLEKRVHHRREQYRKLQEELTSLAAERDRLHQQVRRFLMEEQQLNSSIHATNVERESLKKEVNELRQKADATIGTAAASASAPVPAAVNTLRTSSSTSANTIPQTQAFSSSPAYRSSPLANGPSLPSRSTKSPATNNDENLSQLLDMGFDKTRCENALQATKGNVEQAINILLNCK
ncbi:UBA/EH/EF hand domain-containing protein Ucp8 [Schizosaccharomyces japonicus yFS275]|uniref:UBA/EH/EF hand domain-containing protein Ucp8 n=1 Tax=Schizosaccharomyces japonicus (strain yFS275 / FY16936) TaxID=402676 RepID=B6K362_SCHJY|nr:UBA/EH/EF hand domain-containing protein Ucp8 [Schizosaccharomyces japonicus yFS275]EEB07919.1 UBA/EH/EF hand domain-containing protein Ucp8 [Schizosaccharomyces japonicus yFS275]